VRDTTPGAKSTPPPIPASSPWQSGRPDGSQTSVGTNIRAVFEKVLQQWQNAIGPKGQSEADFERPPARSVAMLAIDACNLSRLPWIALRKRDLRRSKVKHLVRRPIGTKTAGSSRPGTFFWLNRVNSARNYRFCPPRPRSSARILFRRKFFRRCGVELEQFTAVGPPGLQIFRKY
jgi:hypothetical protein